MAPRPSFPPPASQAVTSLEAEAAVFQKQVAADFDLLVEAPMTQSESVAKAVVDAATHTEARNFTDPSNNHRTATSLPLRPSLASS